MKNKTFKAISAFAMVLMMSLTALTGCAQSTEPANITEPADTTESANAAEPANTIEPTNTAELAAGGVLFLRVNPEISVTYDENGNVTKVEGHNDDGSAILENFSGYEGKACRQVVSELVTVIGEAGYFVEEVEGERRQITIEIEAGSALPYDTFLDGVVTDVRECVNRNDWSSPVAVQGESDYGITDYVDTDYGPENDGVTDYDDTDYGPENDGVTDYDDTDYGPENDGVTDYDDGDTDYDDEGDDD